jgi:hypothetical protein
VTLRGNQILGPDTFLLLHRGSRLDRQRLSVLDQGVVPVPAYEQQPLQDGVWLLLRLRRVSEFPVERPWFTLFRQWIGEVVSLVDDAQAQVSTTQSALKALTPDSESSSRLYDLYRQVRGDILKDGVLSQVEAAGYAGTLSTYRRLAIESIQTADYGKFFGQLPLLTAGIETGRAPSAAIEGVYRSERAAAASVRPILQQPGPGVPRLRRRIEAPGDAFTELRHLSRLSEVIRLETARVVRS